jgi:ABC-type metal ion transport system substrate-binding protein
MMKLMTRLTTLILALILALPAIGCQQKDKDKENEKTLDVQVDAGKTKIKVEGTKKPDEKGRHIDVDVEHHSDHQKESGDRDK